MFRASCHCGKTDILRKELVISWVERKCKACKSRTIVYQNNSLVYNFNNEKERREFRYSRKLKRIASMKKLFEAPQMVYYPPPPPSSPNPIISDVFMGYPFPINDIEMDIIEAKPENSEKIQEPSYQNDFWSVIDCSLEI